MDDPVEKFLLSVGYYPTQDGLWMHKHADAPRTLEDAYNYEMEIYK